MKVVKSGIEKLEEYIRDQVEIDSLWEYDNKIIIDEELSKQLTKEGQKRFKKHFVVEGYCLKTWFKVCVLISISLSRYPVRTSPVISTNLFKHFQFALGCTGVVKKSNKRNIIPLYLSVF